MSQESLLIYEQDEVHFCPEYISKTSPSGKLRIIEKNSAVFIEWAQSFDDSNDGDWAVITPPEAVFSNRLTDSVKITHKKNVFPISVELKTGLYFQVSDDKLQVEVRDCDNSTIGHFLFTESCSNYFFDVLKRYGHLNQQNGNEKTEFRFQHERDVSLDERLSDLDLVPKRRSPHRSHPHRHQQWAAEAPRRVWGFINNMKDKPYETTVHTLSKLYDVVLYGEYQESAEGREESDDVGELLQRISGIDDLEPGYEILTKREKLAARPEVERLPPLSHEEFETFVEESGQIHRISSLKERIFKGGIHANLRAELWCYLLGVFDWGSSKKEKEETRLVKERQYFVMKQQWKTLSEEQERNFSSYRDRKSLIEKDVNRTDRNHPFYEGDSNSNLEMLNDILMTYVMYNFDLGYVQGMSDLLAPILYVMQNEAIAFWCFVGYMQRVHRNFDLDQSGMKQQLSDLTQLLKILDPEFVSFLEVQDSSNLFFCFRWLLVRFKRELNYTDTLRLWEVLWTDHYCSNFHLYIAAAILDTERDEIVQEKYSFTDVLKHINGLSLRIDLDNILKKAEAMYLQLSSSSSLPDSLRTLLKLPKKELVDSPLGDSRAHSYSLPGRVERVELVSSLEEAEEAKPSSGHLRERETTPEKSFEKGLSHSFL